MVVPAALQVPLAVPQDSPAERLQHRVVDGAGGQDTVEAGQLRSAGGNGHEMMNVEEVGAAAAEEPANGAAIAVAREGAIA